MSDRELLMAAARAFWAGDIDDVCSIEWSDADGVLYTHGDNQDHNGLDCTYRWNPLEENHDAFDLMVKLRMEVGFAGDHVAAQRTGGKLMTEQRRDGDVQAATRRAIVRVAAQALEIANFQAPGAGHGGDA
ncbi:MAG TPA: hypothetical protein VIN03_11860 [Roseateles sp.]